MRKRAEWMTPVDEEILEVLRDKGNMTPQAIDEYGVCAANYARDRLSELSRYGLTERISRGLYGLTDDGARWLNEELDASVLSPESEDGQ